MDVAFLKRGAVHTSVAEAANVVESMGVFMRVATFLLGIVFAVASGTVHASGSKTVSFNGAHSGVLADGVLAAPGRDGVPVGTGAWIYGQQEASRTAAINMMGFVPAQESAALLRSYRPPLAESTVKSAQRYNPASTPLPKTRTLEDHLLTAFVALMLIAYQLRRKHRFLRPHQFST